MIQSFFCYKIKNIHVVYLIATANYKKGLIIVYVYAYRYIYTYMYIWIDFIKAYHIHLNLKEHKFYSKNVFWKIF